MRRFPSGVVDQYIYFVAVDATDLTTRETGLSSFTVYRSRNSGSATAYTTPTISEKSSANMPGVYTLLLDEDMTLDSGDHSQEVCLHITHAGMAPVTLVFEIYRPDVTAGETLTVSSGTGNAAVQSIANNAITAASIATGAIDADAIADNAIDAGAIASDAITAAKIASDAGTEIATAVWASGTRTLSALDEDSTTLDLDATIRAAVGMASANLDTQLSGKSTLQFGDIGFAVWSIDPADHDSPSTFGLLVQDIKAKTDGLPSDPADASVIAGRFDTLDTAVADLPTNAELATALGTADDAVLTAIDALPTNAELATALASADDAVLAQVALVKAVTDKLDDTLEDDGGTFRFTANALEEAPTGGSAPTADEIADEVETRTLNSNVTKVNNVTVGGAGTEGDPWGPA